MQEDIKCPQCGGNKFRELGDGKYKCVYCGSVFTHKESAPEAPVANAAGQAVPPTFTINVNTAPQPQPAPGGYNPQPQLVSKGKSRTTALLLCFFLGVIGVHKFYLGKTVQGILYLVFCWTWIPLILCVIDFIVLLCTSDRDFDAKYNY